MGKSLKNNIFTVNITLLVQVSLNELERCQRIGSVKGRKSLLYIFIWFVLVLLKEPKYDNATFRYIKCKNNSERKSK